VTDDLLRAGARRLALGPLDDASVASLVTNVLDSSPSDALLDRVRGASGNPLFVIEYARSTSVDQGGTDELDSAAEFRMIVLRRMATLSDATGDAIRLAAVLGSTFSPADLAVATRRSIVELTSSLQHALESSILEERGEHLAFRHALVRDAIYEQIPRSIRRQLHREVGRALAEAGSDALTVGHHLALGAHAEDPEAVDWLRRAARDVAPRSPATAVELLDRARELLGPTSPDRDALLAERAVALAWSGRLAEATELGIQVLDRRPAPDVAGPLRCGLVYALMWQGKPAEALHYAVLGPDDEIGERDAALLLAEAAVASVLAFDFPTAASQAAEAREAAERLGHDLALCHALTAQAWVALFAGRAEEAVEAGLRAVDIADRSTTGEAHLAHPRFFVAQPLLIEGIEAGEEMLRSGLQIAERLGLAWSFPLYHNRLGAFAFMKGDWDAAITECETALAVADEVGLHVASVAVSAAWLAAMQLHRDDIDAAERTMALAMSKFAEEGPQLGMGVINWARALLHEARGEYDEALALLQAAWDLYLAGGPVRDPWSTMLHVRLRVALGDHERAAALLPPFDPAPVRPRRSCTPARSCAPGRSSSRIPTPWCGRSPSTGRTSETLTWRRRARTPRSCWPPPTGSRRRFRSGTKPSRSTSTSVPAATLRASPRSCASTASNGGRDAGTCGPRPGGRASPGPSTRSSPSWPSVSATRRSPSGCSSLATPWSHT
jgi:tetratricopeptide (TPR) repeat protein